MSSLCIAFRDTVRLKDSRIGTIQFIGRTTVKKTIYYGIHLKQSNGSHDGSMHSRRYFKCPHKYGIFVEKPDITEITKKYTISASFHYNQTVVVTNIGLGIIKYVGMTHFGNSYWFGIELEKPLSSRRKSKYNTKNNALRILSTKEINRFHYFDCDENKSIFVRQNQIKPTRTEIYFGQEKKMEEKEEKNDIDPYDNNYLNKTLISMMDSLNIAPNKRQEMLSMDNKNKLLLIQQWFVTPNSNTFNSKELQKTMNKNIKQRKQSQSLILLKKNKKKEHESLQNLQLSPTQSSSKNLFFDGCKINISKQNKLKPIKQKKPKKPPQTIKTSHSLQLNEVKCVNTENKANKPKTQKVSVAAMKYLSYLKVANIKKQNNKNHKNIKKSKSACLLIKKSNLENVKKTKSLKPNAKKQNKKTLHPKKKRNESKSAILLVTKSEKYKLKLKSKKNRKKFECKSSNKKNAKSKRLKSKKSKMKSKKPGWNSAALLTAKDKGKKIKKTKSSVSLGIKSKKKKRKNRHIDKWID